MQKKNHIVKSVDTISDKLQGMLKIPANQIQLK